MASGALVIHKCFPLCPIGTHLLFHLVKPVLLPTLSRKNVKHKPRTTTLVRDQERTYAVETYTFLQESHRTGAVGIYLCCRCDISGVQGPL